MYDVAREAEEQLRRAGQYFVFVPMEDAMPDGRPTERVYRFAFVPSAVPTPAPTPEPDFGLRRPRLSSRAMHTILFGASALTGLAAIVCGLGVWPELDAASWGLDSRGCLCLLAAGIYILAAIVYSAPRTWLAGQPGRAAYDARVMCWILLGVGTIACVAVGLTLAVVAAAIVVLFWLASQLLGAERRE